MWVPDMVNISAYYFVLDRLQKYFLQFLSLARNFFSSSIADYNIALQHRQLLRDQTIRGRVSEFPSPIGDMMSIVTNTVTSACLIFGLQYECAPFMLACLMATEFTVF